MLKKPVLLNGALLLLSGLLTYNVSQMWLSASPPQKANEVLKQSEAGETLLKQRDKPKPIPLSFYDVIGQQNVFRPQRREWKAPPPPPPAPPKPAPQVKKKPEPPSPPPLPDPAVTGIILEENGERIAIMQGYRRQEIKIRSRKRGRIPSRIVADRARVYHEGDTISEAIILEIQEDKVIIEREGKKIELTLGNKASAQIAPPSPRARKGSPIRSPYTQPEVLSPYEQPNTGQLLPLPPRGLTRSERLEKFRASRRNRLRRGQKQPIPQEDK